MTKIYGIKNCDTVKKARAWLEKNKIDYEFHDFKTEGATQVQIKQWMKDIGLEKLANKKGTSWRALDESVKESFNEKTAPKILSVQPTIIKRPLVETAKTKTVGFSEEEFTKLFL